MKIPSQSSAIVRFFFKKKTEISQKNPSTLFQCLSLDHLPAFTGHQVCKKPHADPMMYVGFSSPVREEPCAGSTDIVQKQTPSSTTELPEVYEEEQESHSGEGARAAEAALLENPTAPQPPAARFTCAPLPCDGTMLGPEGRCVPIK